MPKYRHRIFEMYDFRDEAILALAPKSDHSATEATPPETWTFEHLAVSRSERVTHVKFKRAQSFEEGIVSGLREDFAQLAEILARDSRVLLDFTDVTSFSAASLDALVFFRQQLQTKGSRMALCCLDPAAREAIFAIRLT